MNIFSEIYLSPLGAIHIRATESAVLSISFCAKAKPEDFQRNAITQQCSQELSEYFAGTRKQFSVPYTYSGTAFQNMVLQACNTIEYGTTSNYKKLAEIINNPRAARGIGQALARNPLLIVIPCHRIISSSGNISGYAGEIFRKTALLAHEKQYMHP